MNQHAVDVDDTVQGRRRHREHGIIAADTKHFAALGEVVQHIASEKHRVTGYLGTAEHPKQCDIGSSRVGTYIAAIT